MTATQHGEAFVSDFLQHYGVKGMHWGIRKDRNGNPRTVRGLADQAKAKIKQDVAERTSTETTVRAKKGQMVRVVGGVGRHPHQDAITARTAEQIAKKNTLDALSNKELQHLVNRMNLESQYRNLAVNETRKTAGEKFTEQFMADHSDKAFALLGPGAGAGKKVVDLALKQTMANKAMSGGVANGGKKKNK